jgi:uncharacterized protein YjbI with pentapeptide repeats
LPSELEQILHEHEVWLQATPRQGPPPARPVRLAGIDLRDRDLGDRQLREVDFSGLDLSRSKFDGADLTAASFRRSSVVQAEFTGAELRNAVFHDADLERAQFKGAHSLSVDALGGADLTSATLPDEVKEFTGLSAVADVASYTQTLFKITLGLVAFVAVTMASTRDPELLNTNGTGSMKLPILDTPMPTFWFNWIGPFLLLVLYVYMLTYVKQLYALLSYLPAVFPDGSTLDKRAYASLVNPLVRYHFPRLPEDRTWAATVHRWIALILMLWLVPIALSSVWLRCLSAHNWSITIIQVVMLSVAVFASLWVYAIMLTALARGSEPPGRLRAAFERLAVRRGFFIGIAVVVFVLALLFSAGAFAGTNPDTVALVYGNDLASEPAGHWTHRIVPGCFSLLNCVTQFTHMPFADFQGMDVSERPSGSAKKKLTSKELEAVRGAALEKSDLRFCRAYGAFLALADLYRANLSEADLRQANLQSADLRATTLRRAVLTDADLSNIQGLSADFTHAWAPGVDFTASQLYELNTVNLYRADPPTHRGPTTFHSATLTGANFCSADATKAIFNGATLDGAKFRLATVDDADFTGASTKLTDFSNADLRKAVGLTQAQLDVAIGNERTQPPPGLNTAQMIANGRNQPARATAP